MVRKIAMEEDKYPQLVLIGIVCILPMEILTIITKYFHITTITAFEAFSMLFMREPSWTLGLLALPAVGIIGVLSFYYSMIKLIGTKHTVLKAVIHAVTVNAIIFEVFANIIGNHNMIQDTLGNYAFCIGAASAGVTAGYLIKKYIFKDERMKREDGRL